MRLSKSEIQSKINLAIKGNQSACKDLYNNYIAYIIIICKRYQVSTLDQKDYIQDIFSHCFLNLKKYDAHKGDFKYWLRKLAINIILQKKRKKQIIQYQDNLEIVSTNLSATTADNLEMEDILSVLQKMPEKYALMFNLFVIDGYSNKEISKILDVNEGTVRSYVSRGRIWAAKHLKKYYPTYSKKNSL